MKQTDHIDKLFEAQLSGMKAEPPEAAWTNISGALDAAAVPQKSKRKRIVVWLGLTTTVAATLLYFLYLKSCQTDLQTTGQPTLAQTEQVSDTDAQPSSEPTNPVPSPDTAPTISTPLPDNKEVTTHPKQTNSDHMTASSPRTVHITQQQAVSSEPEPTDNPVAKASTKTVQNNQPTNTSQDITEVTSPVKTNLIPEPLVATTEPDSEDHLNNGSSETTSQQPEEQQVAEATTTEEPVESAEPATQPEQSTDKPLSENSELLDSALTEATAPNKATGLNFATGFSAMVYGGPSYLLNNSTRTEAYTEGIYSRHTDDNITGMNAGFGLRYHVNNFFVHSGVQLGSFGEKTSFDWTESYNQHFGFDSTMSITTEYTYDSIDFIVLNNDTIVVTQAVPTSWDTTYSAYSIDSTMNEDHQRKTRNQYRFIEIPLMLGYRFEYQRFSIDVASGIGVAIPYGAKGYYLANGTLQPMDNNEQMYKHTVVNYLLSAGVHYHLNRRTSVSFMPMYRTNLTRLHTNSEARLPENYHSFSANFGLTYMF